MTKQDAADTVAVLVSNQSFDVNPVDITISIDGQVVVQGEFNVEGDQPPQHNWHSYNLPLEEGAHELVAKSSKGRAQLQTTFEMPGIHTITVAYWYGRQSARSKPEGYFTAQARPDQPATM